MDADDAIGKRVYTAEGSHQEKCSSEQIKYGFLPAICTCMLTMKCYMLRCECMRMFVNTFRSLSLPVSCSCAALFCQVMCLDVTVTAALCIYP